MAIRTTSDAVKAIIETDDDVSEDLAPFIETASFLVDSYCEPEGGSATELELIERWLSAHFYAQRDPRAASEGVSSVNVSYQTSVKVGLANTHYGQMAMRIDTSGALAAMDKGAEDGSEGVGSKKVSILHIGPKDKNFR